MLFTIGHLLQYLRELLESEDAITVFVSFYEHCLKCSDLVFDIETPLIEAYLTELGERYYNKALVVSIWVVKSVRIDVGVDQLAETY